MPAGSLLDSIVIFEEMIKRCIIPIMRLSMPKEKISFDEMRRIDPILRNLSDEELEKARESFYQFALFSLETYIESKQSKQL